MTAAQTGLDHSVERIFAMFWTFLIVLVIAVGFLKIGAWSVWLSLATLALQIGAVVLGVVIARYIWRRMTR